VGGTCSEGNSVLPCQANVVCHHNLWTIPSSLRRSHYWHLALSDWDSPCASAVIALRTPTRDKFLAILLTNIHISCWIGIQWAFQCLFGWQSYACAVGMSGNVYINTNFGENLIPAVTNCNIIICRSTVAAKYDLYSASHSLVAPENVGLQKEQKCITFVFIPVMKCGCVFWVFAKRKLATRKDKVR
jgi:hypothetical protein